MASFLWPTKVLFSSIFSIQNTLKSGLCMGVCVCRIDFSMQPAKREINAGKLLLNMTYIESVKETWLNSCVDERNILVYVKYLLVGVKSPKSNMNERTRAGRQSGSSLCKWFKAKWQIDTETHIYIICKCIIVRLCIWNIV